MNDLKFGIRIKSLRENAKHSQYTFAAALGVAQSTVASWEAGKREPNLEMVSKLADFFDVSTDYLLGRTDNPDMHIITAPAELADAGVVSVEKTGSGQLTEEEVNAIRKMLERETARK